VGFWSRADAFFCAIGITVTAVMTDNGSCYRSRDVTASCTSDQARAATSDAWRHHDNHHRPHTGVGGTPAPAALCDSPAGRATGRQGNPTAISIRSSTSATVLA